MATFGTLKEFCPASDWMKTYLQRVDLYFAANSVKDDKKVAILLTSIGASTYDRLCDLMAPDAPSTKTLDKISTTLSTHFKPRRVQIADRFHFQKREQAAGETIVQYDAALRRLATHCDFDTNLETELRDQIVCGLQHEPQQHRLLSEADLTYKKTMEMAQATELVDKHIQALRSNTTEQIHSVSRNSPPPRGQTRDCYRCSGKHNADDCRFKEAVCHFCKKKGHIARVCRSKAKQQKGGKTTTYRKPPGKTNLIHIDEKGSEYTLNHLDGKQKSPYTVELSVNGAPLKMEVDTGAAVSLISEVTYKRLWKNPPKLKPTTTRLRTYSGQQLVVLGTLVVNVEYKTQQVARSLIVVKGSGPSLLGRDWLAEIRLHWKRLSVQQTSTERPLKDILKRHESLFRPVIQIMSQCFVQCAQYTTYN